MDSVRSVERSGARENFLLVFEDGLAHLRGSGRRGIIRRASLEMFDDLGAAVAGALDYAIESGFVYEFGDGNTGYGGIAGKRDHGVAVSAENAGANVLDTDFEFLGDKSAEAGGGQYAGHPDDALARESAHLVGGLCHGVERIGDDDEDAVRRVVHDLADYVVHDFVVSIQKIVAAHAGLARNSSGDDDDVGVGGVGVVVRADDVGIALLDRHGFEQVETLSLRDAFHDVAEHDVAQFFGADPLSRARPPR